MKKQIIFIFCIVLISALAMSGSAVAIFDSGETQITVLDENQDSVSNAELRITRDTDQGSIISEITTDENGIATDGMETQEPYRIEYITDNVTYSTNEFTYDGGNITVEISGEDLQVSQVSRDGFVLGSADDLPGNEISNYGSYIGGLAIVAASLSALFGILYRGLKYVKKKK